jgi:hypothetical protein
MIFPAPLLALLQELGDLKRVRSAARPGSIAERLFADGWTRLLAGVPAEDAMRGNVAAALTATRLGDIDAAALRTLDLAEHAIARTLGHALAEITAALDPALAAGLEGPRRDPPAQPLPAFVARLAAQPRAGVTCPGRPRLLFEPPENHAEHSAMVAVYGVLLAPVFGADPSTVWLAGLAHHLHNADLPDAGYTGEMLLEPHLAALMERATARSLAQLPTALAATVETARRILPDAETPEGRAFHAADALDRVWQIDQHLRAGRTLLETILTDMALVHEGPVKTFQDHVLRAAGLPA